MFHFEKVQQQQQQHSPHLMNAAMAARDCGSEDGSRPPPITISPPTAVMPEIAFVTDIRGLWRAGVTPHTV